MVNSQTGLPRPPQLIGPPVYRPSTVPRLRTASSAQRMAMPGGAPPVYRPDTSLPRNVVQRKPGLAGAPPVYRPDNNLPRTPSLIAPQSAAQRFRASGPVAPPVYRANNPSLPTGAKTIQRARTYEMLLPGMADTAPTIRATYSPNPIASASSVERIVDLDAIPSLGDSIPAPAPARLSSASAAASSTPKPRTALETAKREYDKESAAKTLDQLAHFVESGTLQPEHVPGELIKLAGETAAGILAQFVLPCVTSLGKAIKGAYDAHSATQKAEEHTNVVASTSDEISASAAAGMRAGQVAKKNVAITSAVSSLLSLPADILLPGTGVGAAIRLAAGYAAKAMHRADLKQYDILALVLWHMEGGSQHRQVMAALGLTESPTRTVGVFGLAQHQMLHASVSAERSRLAKSEVVPLVARDLTRDEAFRSMAITEGSVNYVAWGEKHKGILAALKKWKEKRAITKRMAALGTKAKLAAAAASARGSGAGV